MEAFRTVPSGLRMLLRMSENSWGTYVDCQVSSWSVLIISFSRVFYVGDNLHCDRHLYNQLSNRTGGISSSWL
jgi:hypothetical protein